MENETYEIRKECLISKEQEAFLTKNGYTFTSFVRAEIDKKRGVNNG